MSALARLLVDFGAPLEHAGRDGARPERRREPVRESGRGPGGEHAVVAFDELAPSAPANAPAAPAPSLEETLAAARAAARAEGLAEGLAQGLAQAAAAEAQAQARFAAQAAEHEAGQAAALAQARVQWARAQGEALAAKVEKAFAALREEVEEGVAAVLRPLAEASAAREAARLMAGEIARLLAGAGQGAPLDIAGPADLIDAVRDALDRDPRVGPGPAREGRLRFVEAEGVDAFARLGRAEVETRLAAFSRALERPEQE